MLSNLRKVRGDYSIFVIDLARDVLDSGSPFLSLSFVLLQELFILRIVEKLSIVLEMSDSTGLVGLGMVELLWFSYSELVRLK